MKKIMILAACLLSAFLFSACAQNADLVLLYNFQDVEGDTVRDGSFSGIDARLMGGAEVESLGRFHVLHLPAEGAYLDMTGEAGKLLASLSDFTVSVYYKTDINPRFPGFGYFVWMFSTEEFCGPETGRYFAYRINEQRAETSVGGYNHESVIMKGEKSETGRWIHVLYTQNGTNGALYIDGELFAKNESMPVMKDNFAAQHPAFCWLGRPAFRGDHFLHDSWITDFRIYERAFDNDEIRSIAAYVSELNIAE